MHFGSGVFSSTFYFMTHGAAGYISIIFFIRTLSTMIELAYIIYTIFIISLRADVACL